jgi:hypothetical protein
MHDVDGGHHMMESQGRARATMFLALLAVVGIAVKFLTIAALHFLRPDVNPVLEPISNYGVGPYGFLLTVADIGSVVATLALVFGLRGALSSRPLRRLRTARWDLSDRCRRRNYDRRHHPLHRRQYISFFCFPIAAILLSLRMGKDEQWRSLRPPALALSIVVVLTVILTIAGFNLGIGFGVTQRVANVAVLVWMLVVALHLRSVAQGALAQQPSRAS